MAVIHVTEAEAIRNLPSSLTRVKEGELISIDDAVGTVATVQAGASGYPQKSLSEAIRWAEERDLQITLDGAAAEHTGTHQCRECGSDGGRRDRVASRYLPG